MLRLETAQESGAFSCAEIENIHDLATALLQACGEDFQLAVEALLIGMGVHDDIVTARLAAKGAGGDRDAAIRA